MNTATNQQLDQRTSFSTEPMTINIAKDFSPFPGARFETDGPYSGEEFRKALLEPKFKEAMEKDVQLFIHLDGAIGYPASFLEEAFGGLVRRYKRDLVLSHLKFICLDEPGLEDEIKEYIFNAT